jgi:predicted metal-dependent hydrolase
VRTNEKIILNVELLKAPKDCIDYVILHELCHLKEHHHGPRFWRLLDRLMPDWRNRRTLLNQMADV